MTRHWFAVCVLVAGILMSGCRKKEGQSQDIARQDILAMVGQHVITTKDFQNAIEQLSSSAKRQYLTLKHKAGFLENLIHFEIMILEAKRRKLENSGLVKELRERAMIELQIRRKAQKFKTRTITLREMRHYYKTHYHIFNRPEKRRAQHIFFRVKNNATPADWNKVEQHVKKLMPLFYRMTLRPKVFDLLVLDHSQDPLTKKKRGDLGFSAKTQEGGRWDSSFSKVVFSLKVPGSLAGPIRSAKGFHVVRLTEITPSLQQSFAEVQSYIQNQIQEEQKKLLYKKYIQTLRKKYTVKINQEVLLKIKPISLKKQQLSLQKQVFPKIIIIPKKAKTLAPTSRPAPKPRTPTSRPIAQPKKSASRPSLPTSRPATQPAKR